MQNSNAYILLRYYHIYLSYKLQEAINIFPIDESTEAQWPE